MLLQRILKAVLTEEMLCVHVAMGCSQLATSYRHAPLQ